MAVESIHPDGGFGPDRRPPITPRLNELYKVQPGGILYLLEEENSDARIARSLRFLRQRSLPLHIITTNSFLERIAEFIPEDIHTWEGISIEALEPSPPVPLYTENIIRPGHISFSQQVGYALEAFKYPKKQDAGMQLLQRFFPDQVSAHDTSIQEGAVAIVILPSVRDMPTDPRFLP